MALWRQKKLRDIDAKRDLLLTRARGCRQLVDEIDWFMRKEWELGKLAVQKRVSAKQRAGLGKFRQDARIDRWA